MHEKPIITEAMQQAYVAGDEVACPFCGESDLQGGAFDGEAGEVWQEITCMACGEAWQDIYTFARIDNEFT